jgi:hypothetical protein
VNLSLRLVLAGALLLPFSPIFAQSAAGLVKSQYPAAGATGVPRNTLILLRLDPTLGQSCYSARLTPAGGAPVFLSAGYGWGDETAIERYYIPQSPLLASTSYTFNLDCQPQSWSFQFTTGSGSDLDGPRLVSVSPDPDSSEISPFGPFTLRFSRPIAYLDQAVSVTANTGGTYPATFRLSADRLAVEVRPQLDYTLPRVLLIRCDPAKVFDLNNNPGQGAESTTRYFTSLVTDRQGPQLLGSYPEAGESGVPTNAQIQLLFDRTFALYYNPSLTEDAIVVEARGARVPARLESSGALIRVTGITLLPNTTYRVRITPKLVDAIGIPVSTETTLEFTTGLSAEPDSSSSSTNGPSGATVPLNALFVFRSARRLPSFAPLMITQLNRCTESSACIRREVNTQLQDGGRILVMTPKEPLPSWSTVNVDLTQLADITGASLSTGPWSASTNDQVDTTTPSLIASSPADGETNVRVDIRLRFLFDEPVGLATPLTAVRLTRDGEVATGKYLFYQEYSAGLLPQSLEFVPNSPLAPGADYEMELVGMADIAGNIMPTRKIRFKTATDAQPPTGNPVVTSTTLDSGQVGALEPLVLETNLPMSAARMIASVAVSASPSSSSGQVFSHPVRVEVSGATTRIVPLLPWPANRNLVLSLTWNDQGGRYFSYSATFLAASAGDTDRPEVTSVSPAPGSVLRSGQTIQLRFSKPMLDATQPNGGLSISVGASPWPSTIYWSPDRTTATMLLGAFNSSEPIKTISLAVTSALTDLSGNPAKALTAAFQFIRTDSITMGAPRILKSWPPVDYATGPVDLQAKIVLYLSRPVSAESFNRNVWVTTKLGRASGTWLLSSDGLLATFQADQPWPAGSAVRLMQVEPVLDGGGVTLFQTKSEASSVLAVLRTSLSDPHPANAVIDIEFNQDLPSGPGPLRLQTGGYPPVDIPIDELRPRPNVLRLAPRSPLTVGNYFGVTIKPGSTLTWSGQSVQAGPPLGTAPAEVLYRSPAPDSAAVPRNARISLMPSAAVNLVSASLTNVTISSGGTPLPASLYIAGSGARLTLTPLSPLPANAQIDVSITGLEDRLGRPIPASTWSFTTGDSIDLTAPNLIYSSANKSFDPLARLSITFDEPLDPAFTDGLNRSDNPLEWSFSSDLRTLSLIPPTGWSRGESLRMFLTLFDRSGNSTSPYSLDATAGFEPDRTPPVLRAISVLDGQKNLPLSTTIALLFNKPLGSEALRSVRLTSNNGEVPLTAGAWDGNRAKLTPANLLTPLTRYQLIVEGIQDASGNLMADRTEISFETGESFSEAPLTARYSFTAVDAPLTVRFSQPIDGTRLPEIPSVLSQRDSATSYGYGVPIPADLVLSSDRTLLTITPRRAMALGYTYTVQLGYTTGSAGGEISPPTYSFTPGQSVDTSPVRVRFMPVDGSTNVALNALPVVTFSRAVTPVPAIRLREGDKQVAITLTAMQVGDGFSQSYLIQRALKPNQLYRIEVDGFRDAFDNDVPASTGSFTTGANADYASFRLVSTSPANGEAGVDPASPWTFTFSSPLMPLSPLGVAVRSSRGIPFTTTTQYNGPQVTFAGVPAWPAASTIAFSWSQYSGQLAPTSWTNATPQAYIDVSFRTAAVNDPTPPVLELIDPPSGSTIPGAKAKVTLRFSKPVMIPYDSLQIFYGATRANVYGAVASDLRTITYVLEPPAKSRVTIVGTDGIRDNADNPLAPFVIEYDTGDNAPVGSPKVTRTEPAPYSYSPAATKITIEFDRVMAADSVLAALHVTQNGQNVTGSTEVLDNGRTYRFTPTSPFSAGAAVKVFLLKTAVDPDGIPVVLEYGWPLSFTITGTPASTQSLQLTRRGFLTSAPVDSTLEFELSQELDPESVNGDSVWLRRGSSLIPGDVSLRDRAIVQFRPKAPLEVGADYVLTAGSALRDLDGRQFPGQDLRFRAVVTTAAADLESATEAEWQGRAAVRVRFTGPLSPLAIHGLRLDRDGAPVDAEVLPTTDPRELLLVPSAASQPGKLHVNLDRVPEANGRPLPFRRMPAEGRGTGR